ncbi:MAG TPA: F0F1 ATP synthase subunit delta [Streptosporangiaceae bacterium]|nr:F0F1 ATP synthase subunit delta [Streptosporangiaceae bacterium]
MRGASRASLAAAKDRLAAALADGTAGQATRVGDELFAVTGLLDREPALRRNLSDPAISEHARAGLAESLLGGRISGITLAQVTGLAADRWSGPGDLADATEDLAVVAICAGADLEGQLDELEDQLFRFGRIVGADPALRYALSNFFVPAQGRRDLVTDLLAGKVTDSSLRLIGQAAAQPRGRSVDASLERYAGLAAALRERLIAEVHVAATLTIEQRTRLAATLSAAYGHDVHLNVVLDPDLIGGMSVRIGDEQVNGSALARLAELRRTMAA